MDNNYLQHHGVLGMKWGKRKARYTSDDHTRAHSKKKSREMSDDELRKRINRLQMEQQYKTLSKPRISAGKKIVAGILVGSATAVASVYVKKYIDIGVKAIGNQVIKNIRF